MRIQWDCDEGLVHCFNPSHHSWEFGPLSFVVVAQLLSLVRLNSSALLWSTFSFLFPPLGIWNLTIFCLMNMVSKWFVCNQPLDTHMQQIDYPQQRSTIHGKSVLLGSVALFVQTLFNSGTDHMGQLYHLFQWHRTLVQGCPIAVRSLLGTRLQSRRWEVGQLVKVHLLLPINFHHLHYYLNHYCPATPHHLPLWSVEKLSSTKRVPGATKVGHYCTCTPINSLNLHKEKVVLFSVFFHFYLFLQENHPSLGVLLLLLLSHFSRVRLCATP